MVSEVEWVESLKTAISASFVQDEIIVQTRKRLPYEFHIDRYADEKQGQYSVSNPVFSTNAYQTDMILVEQQHGSNGWIPRVVVEFKFGSVTTHDALTYSTKAATHKNVHPYLRYGLVIGGFNKPVPTRVIRHGQHFDFMATISSESLTNGDQTKLTLLLKEEVAASRTIGKMIREKNDAWLIHRQLSIK